MTSDRLGLAAELLGEDQWQLEFRELVKASAVLGLDRPALLNAGAPGIAAANWGKLVQVHVKKSYES